MWTSQHGHMFLQSQLGILESVEWVLVSKTCNIIMEVAFYFCHVILARSKSQVPPTLKENEFKNILIDFWVFIGMWAFSSCVGRGCSSLWCLGFSLWWLLLLQSMSSECSGCGSQVYFLCCMWDLLGPGIEPMSPAWGTFLSAGPPGKSQENELNKSVKIRKWGQPRVCHTWRQFCLGVSM